MLFRLEAYFQASKAGEPRTVFAAQALTLCFSNLRFCHAQRGPILRLTSLYAEAVCSRGKTSRAAYHWRAPRFGPLGADIGETVWDAQEALKKPRNAH